jgi:HEAT repeat protein
MLRDKRAVEVLVPLLRDKSGFVVSTAIESLKTIGGDEACRAIAAMLSSEDDEVKRTAILSLEGFEGVEEIILPFLRDPDWAARTAAVKALGRRSRGTVRVELERLLDTEEDPTVIKAIEEILRA